MQQTAALDSGFTLVQKRRRQLVIAVAAAAAFYPHLHHLPRSHSRPPTLQEEDFVPWRDKREENKKSGGMQPTIGSRFDKKAKVAADDGAQ
jgi:hypothetical protein